MRLLNTSTQLLRDFASGDIPAYAIFSHTWGAAENEVLYADIERGTAANKPSYTKLQYACSQALEHNLSWIWIDTCCIDKGSSAELSEAINSMYKWYSEGITCYAYLDDVDASGAQFAESRWFTRGWTLQELLAPTSLVFFSNDWTLLGTKSTMYTALSKITEIDVGVLTGEKPLSSVSIATRMSWASRRETGRPEDIAYCLMGLFDVNMPMLYGEGDKAFIRLQEEIMKYSDDQSIFAWKHHERLGNESYYGLLAKHPREFAESHNIVPYGDSDWRRPFSTSNRGLCIELPLSRCDQSLYIAALDCPAPPNYRGFLGIYLKLLSSGNRGERQFARVKTGEFCQINSRGSLEKIYVRQKIILPASQDIYPMHFLQLRGGPDSQDSYKLIKVTPFSNISSLPPLGGDFARARGWMPKDQPFVFELARGIKQCCVTLLFERIDGNRIVVLLGSTVDFGVGFDLLEVSLENFIPDWNNIHANFNPRLPGECICIQDHRVSITITIQVKSRGEGDHVKFYLVDVTLEALLDTPNGIITTLVPKLHQLIGGDSLTNEHSTLPGSRQAIKKRFGFNFK